MRVQRISCERTPANCERELRNSVTCPHRRAVSYGERIVSFALWLRGDRGFRALESRRRELRR